MFYCKYRKRLHLTVSSMDCLVWRVLHAYCMALCLCLSQQRYYGIVFRLCLDLDVDVMICH